MNNRRLSIKEALIRLYNHRYEDYTLFLRTKENHGKASLFAKFTEFKFSKFICIVKSINREELSQFIIRVNDFVSTKTRRRFINLLELICKRYIGILRKCYCSNPAGAILDLGRLLGANNHQLMKYIIEPLINYCSYAINQKAILYRVREEEEGKDVDNCWHTPFYIRQHCHSGRFSTPSFPCLYLGQEVETCVSETGEIKPGNKRWLGEFRIKGNKPLIALDLRFPSESAIKNFDDYDTFCAFLSYPLRLLCGIYAHNKSDSFAEEYLFSQLLINLLSNQVDDNLGLTTIYGVMYDSTKNKGGINYAFPAIPQNYPPKEDEKVSERLMNLFVHNKPAQLI